jgi:protein phosphatase-4 regulatory subunit 3
MIINLNGNGDGMSNKPDPAPMEVDQKPAVTSSPKPVNGLGTVTAVNGRGVRRANSSAFSSPEDLTAEDIALRREVIILLQQLCIMGKNVQMPARMALFRTLVDRGVLFATQWALSLPETDAANKLMISAAGEVLSALLDHDLNGVRGHVLKQVNGIEKEREAGKRGADKAESVLEMACRVLATSKDLALQSQIGDALKVWLDIPPLDPIPAGVSEVSDLAKIKFEPKFIFATQRLLDPNLRQ